MDLMSFESEFFFEREENMSGGLGKFLIQIKFKLV